MAREFSQPTKLVHVTGAYYDGTKADAIGVATVDGASCAYGTYVTICYPLHPGDDAVRSGLECGPVKAGTLSVKPATLDEVKAWRAAGGVLKSGRRKCNTDDKLMDLKWVRYTIQKRKKTLLEPTE